MDCGGVRRPKPWSQASHSRAGKEGLEAWPNADGAGAGSAHSVGRAEGLVEVEVHGVKAHVAGPALAKDRVEIRPIVVHERVHAVGEVRDLAYRRLEQAVRVRARQHDARHGVAQQRL
jgi:hypothetical protein